jgi:hypothetical protein
MYLYPNHISIHPVAPFVCPKTRFIAVSPCRFTQPFHLILPAITASCEQAFASLRILLFA